jgi:hypothetical protein
MKAHVIFVVALGAIAAASACSDSGSSDGGGGGKDGSAGTGGAGGSSGSGTDSSACPAPAGTGRCETCAFEKCCPERAACVADAECQSGMAQFFQCLDAATQDGGEPAGDECDMSFTADASAIPATELATCVHDRGCDAVCL